MNWYCLVLAWGETPFSKPELICSEEVGIRALSSLRELVRRGDPSGHRHNPIESLDLLSSGKNQEKIYSLFPYGYSNYSKRGYADKLLQFGELPLFQGRPLRTTIGGTGIAVSVKAKYLEIALDYARYTACSEVQRTIFTDAGGQPSHRKAWTDEENNRLSLDFFKNTLPLLDRSFLRPRYAGYDQFQEHAGPLINQCLYGSKTEQETFSELQKLHFLSLEEVL